MRITFNKLTALHILRVWRSSGRTLTADRHRLETSVVAPHRYWTRRRIGACLESVGTSLSSVRERVQVMVPRPGARIRSRTARNTVYVRGLPASPVVELNDSTRIPCPELLFIELGTIMSPAAQLLAGLELCGRFSRDACDPRDGTVTYEIKPVTTADKIRSYVLAARDLAGLEQSRRVAEWLMDEAWSPQEALLNGLARMPLHELGYELGELQLNPRFVANGKILALVNKTSRVPDSLVAGSTIGFNYDGGPHFGESGPEAAGAGFLDSVALASVREAVVADKRRDRDLLVQGLSVLPVTKEDFYERGGIDRVMQQAMSLLERTAQRDFSKQRRALSRPRLAAERQRLIWSLLPGRRGRELSRELARVEPPEAVIEDYEIAFGDGAMTATRV
ncbi:hypothetical protein SAMN05216348_1117 [Olsenella sp. KH3B4]|uniref:hypothetical protein n=1 Tax=Olsenella sp. KH3B4 TaxID=1855394 RepID=UPI0008CC16B8|nr:hypothetical protein [Olsenella sp. KH3B4]SET24149.1 hypothetical protein SAMN05216348_1117 [Olsenella sp. KH3B4]